MASFDLLSFSFGALSGVVFGAFSMTYALLGYFKRFDDANR